MNLNDLRDDWKEVTLDLYKEGAADVEVKAALGLTNNAWTTLLMDSAEFRTIIIKGQQMSEAFWYRVGRENLYRKDFQQVLWYRNMQNRFGWRDKADNTTSDRVDEEENFDSIEDVDQEIANVARIRGSGN